jgi:hypothetical protein
MVMKTSQKEFERKHIGVRRKPIGIGYSDAFIKSIAF